MPGTIPSLSASPVISISKLMFRFLKTLLSATLLPLLVASCVTSEDFADTHTGNFEALWQTIDEHYCFFDYKNKEYGLDWNEVYQRYKPQISDDMSMDALFQVLSNMTYELRDGHVNLSCASNTSYYTQWYEAYPMNFSDSIFHKYMGTSGDYRSTAGMQYRVMRGNTGYIRCSSFEYAIGDGNLHQIMDYLGSCNGLIIDVRSNSGGLLTSATKLAGLFVNEDTTLGYISHKTGKGHNDFSQPQSIVVSPSTGLRWQKPVVVLANRRTYSAANAFVMFMKGLQQLGNNKVTIMGDTTGGGSGMPFSSELPEGWSVRFSACPMTDVMGQQTEFGIEPNIIASITSEDYQKSVDTILETAIDYLRK